MLFKNFSTDCYLSRTPGSACRAGLRSPAATCDQTCFDFKITSPKITAPLFVSPCCISLTVRLAAVTKNPARQAGPTEIAKAACASVISCDSLKTENGRLNTSALRRTCLSCTPPGIIQPPGFLNKCRDPRIDEFRLCWLVPPQAHSAPPRSLLHAIRLHSRSQSLVGYACSRFLIIRRDVKRIFAGQSKQQTFTCLIPSFAEPGRCWNCRSGTMIRSMQSRRRLRSRKPSVSRCRARTIRWP